MEDQTVDFWAECLLTMVFYDPFSDSEDGGDTSAKAPKNIDGKRARRGKMGDMRGSQPRAEAICNLKDVRRSQVGLVGGKNASLGEMIGELASEGIPVPPGFAVSLRGFRSIQGC